MVLPSWLNSLLEYLRWLRPRSAHDYPQVVSAALPRQHLASLAPTLRRSDRGCATSRGGKVARWSGEIPFHQSSVTDLGLPNTKGPGAGSQGQSPREEMLPL